MVKVNVNPLVKILIGSLMVFFSLLPNISHAEPDPIWPWENVQPFPWDIIQGTWAGVIDSGETIYFSFEVVLTESGQQRVKIKQVDPETKQVYAVGMGRVSGKVLKSRIISPHHKFIFTARYVDNYYLNFKKYLVVTIEGKTPRPFRVRIEIDKFLNDPVK